MERTKILIVGGGIGGLAVALGLARRGLQAQVIEQAPEFGEVGAGIQLAPNAAWALDQLGVLEAVHRHAVFPERLIWMDATSGQKLTGLDLGEKFRAHYGYPYVVMHRVDLLDALLDAARAEPNIKLETDRAVVGFTDKTTSAVVSCADGSEYEADIVIGADGLHSRLRSEIIDDGTVGSHYVAYRGTIPIGEVSAHAGFDNVIVWTGPEMHLVQYPIRRGELFNQVAVFKSNRYREDSDDWGTPDELDAKFSTGVELVRQAITKMGRLRRWPMYDRKPIDNWTRNRLVLLGDAAHPMLQYLAQGAAQALEDAAVLSAVLAAHPNDPTTAFRIYQSERAPRTARVQTLARVWGDYWHLHPGPEKARRDARLQARPDDDFTDSDWFYAYRGLGANNASTADSTTVPR